MHAAAPANLAGCFHRCIPGRADTPAGYGNHPTIVPVATALPRDDMDSVDTVVIMPQSRSGLAPRVCRVDRGRADERGGEKTRIFCRSYPAVPSLTLVPSSSIVHQQHGERFFQNSQSIAITANKFGDPRLPQSRFRLSRITSREINARRSGGEQPRGGVD